jgi:hypothetical protein
MTLVEILFSFAIVSVVLTLSYAAALNAWRNAVSANQRTQAQYLVQQGIESIKAYKLARDPDFSWLTFLDELPDVGNDFHLVMTVDGVENPSNSYACPGTPAICKFVVKNGGVPMQSIGSNIAAGNDATLYTLSIMPVEIFEKDSVNATARTATTTTDPQITAISFVATVTWTGADGVNNNVTADAIITKP